MQKMVVAKKEMKPTAKGGTMVALFDEKGTRFSGFLPELKEVNEGDEVELDIEVDGKYLNIKGVKVLGHTTPRGNGEREPFPADPQNFILQAHTTSLAEIPTFRTEIRKLNVLMEQLLEERTLDPDEGLVMKDEVKQALMKCSKQPECFITSAEMEKRLAC